MGKLKKTVSFLLILILALGFFQPVSAEEGNSVKVGIRVETMDSTLIPLTYVTMPTTHKSFSDYGVSDQTDPGFDTPVHVLAQYLMDNMETTATDMGTMIGIAYSNLAQICGMYANGTDVKDTSHFWMYMLNDEYPALNGMGYSMTDCPLKNGDIITIYAMSYPGTAFYSYFQKQEYAVTQGEAVSLALMGRNTMGGTSLPISGAKIISSKDGESATIETAIVTDEQGKATISFSEPGTYTLSSQKADISRAYAKVVVTKSEAEADKTLVEADKVALSIPLEASADLALPTVGASGKTMISWASSNECVKSDGKITRGTEDQQITLTATITKGSVTDTKIFKVMVKAYSDTEISAAIAAIKTALTTTVKPVEGTDTNLIDMLQKKADQVALGSKISLTDVSAQSQVDSNGNITYGDKAVKNKDVKFNISLLGKSETGIVKVTIPAHVLTAQETVDTDVKELTWDKIKNKNTTQASVKTSVSLPKTGDSYATDIVWSSSNPELVSNTGTVTRPAYQQPDGKVTLTATVKPSPYMEMYGHPGTAESRNVTIEVTVSAFSQEEYDSAKQDVAAVKNYFQNTYKIKIINTGELADLAKIDYDLSFSGNSVKDTGVSDVDVEWSSGNPAIVVNTYRGKVIRPAVNEKASSGKLVATITKAGYSETVEFDTSVLPVTQIEIDKENEKIKTISENLSFDLIKKENLNPEYVTTGLQMLYRGYCDENKNITYSTKNNGENGINITWETSNDKIIASYGSVTRPKINDEPVTMTATLSSIVLKDVVGVTSQKVIIPVTVIKPTPKLGNITLSAGDLAFTPDTYVYSIEIPEGVTEITLGLTKFDSAAKVQVTGTVTDENGNYRSKLDSVVTIKSTLGGDSVEYKIDFVTKDQIAARSVVDQITALPEVDKLVIGDKASVATVRSAYEELTDVQKALVTNSKTLTDVEEKIAKLVAEEANTAAAKAVVDQIAGLPTLDKLTLDNKVDVIAARTAYKVLTDAQKILVNNLSTLEAAEKQIEILESPAPTPTPAPSPTPDPGTAKDEATGIEMVGFPKGVGLKVEIETNDAEKTEEAAKAATEAGIKNVKVVSLYSIKPDMSDEDLAEFNHNPESFVTLTIPLTIPLTMSLADDQQGYDSYKIYHKKTDGSVEWISPTLSADGKSLIFKVNAFSEFGVVGIKETTEIAAVDFSYRTHVQNVGWQDWKNEGAMSGTQGQSLRLEGIEIKRTDSADVDLGIRYETHIENIGWEDSWKADGTMSGTEGKAQRLEAIRIELTGADAENYDVYYQVHAQNTGWMAFAQNGQDAGTAGFGYRLEGIRVVVVPKGQAAPTPEAGSIETAFLVKK